MGFSTHRTRRALRGWTLVAAAALVAGCVSPQLRRPAYAYFEEPAPNDPWTHKIRLWQTRARTERAEVSFAAPAPVAEGQEPSELPAVNADLRAKYDAFRSEQKRAAARRIAAWIQTEARSHYMADGAIDHWATLEETFRNNGDDCDGLELLVFQFLRDAGFTADEVFRAVVYRRTDGQHHMVTFWFEDPNDPWVIDPTGAMTSGMPRMSELADWVPLKVFDRERVFTVRDPIVAQQ